MEFEDLEQQAKVLQDENARLQQVLGLAAADDDDDDGEEANGDEEEGQGTDDESEMTGGEEEEYEDDLRDEVSVAGAMQHLAGGVYEPVYHTISPSPYDPGLHGSSTTSISMPPVNPAEIRRALALNLQYREILRQQLKSIETARARNADYQKRIKALIAQSQKKTARKPGKRSFTAPYFATTSGAVPPDNRDAARRRLYLKSLPNGFKFKKWNQNEEKALAAGVRTANQGILWSRMMENSHAKTSEELRMEGDRIKNMTTDELLENLHGLDWDVIAKVHVPTRSAMDCKIQWTQVQHPSIPKGDRKSKFVKSEDTRLLALANAHKGHDWEAIASELGTGRTPAQCFQRYQRSLNTNIMKTKWTKEEDQQLIEAVRQWGQKNWQQVAHCLTDRTGQQCLHRWQKTLNPEIRRGRWTPAEDMMLTMAVKAYADNLRWVKVQAHVPGRTDVQCRERWVNILNPALNNGPWTEEEDEKLRQAVAAFPTGKWAEISRMLAPRTDNQCWRRWKTLAGEEVEIYRKNVHKKRKGLINNFVGREKERPDLTVADFELNEPPQQPRKRRPSTPEEATSTLPPSDASSTNGDSTSTSTSTSATPSSVPPEGAAPLPGLMILPLEDSSRRSADETTPAAGTATARGTGAKRGRKRKEPSAEEAAAAPTTPAKRGRKKKTPDENGGAATPVAASTTPTAATAAAAGAAAAPPGPRKRGRPRKVVAPPAPAPVPAPAPAPSPAPTESREGAQEAETQSDKTAGEETPEAEPLKTPASTTNLRRSTRSTRSKKKTND